MLLIHHFPTQLRCAVISMVKKLGVSYLPISLLSTSSKLFEGIVLSRTMAVRRVQDVTPDHQFGFRCHRCDPQRAQRETQHIVEAF